MTNISSKELDVVVSYEAGIYHLELVICSSNYKSVKLFFLLFFLLRRR